MTSMKAVLSIVLKADEVIVVEAADPVLWRQVLGAIQSGSSSFAGIDDTGVRGGGNVKNSDANSPLVIGGEIPLDKLAGRLGIEKVKIQGACSPSAEPPYLHLDTRCWEEMRKQVPRTGKLAIAPAVAAATLLLLWADAAVLGSITQSQARAVLNTIHATDKNPSRSINNASWLQIRPGQIVLNPADISRAVKLAACFCTKDWKAWTETNHS